MAERVRLQREGVASVAACTLAVGTERWAFAEDHRDRIAAHWHARRAENPKFFNGAIFVLTEAGIDGDRFSGTLARIDFASYLYWRETGFADETVRDCFGTGVIVSADGAVLLARQKAGQINSGFAYLPGGFIDARDVAGDHTVDVGASISREIAEETGLGSADLDPQPGLLLSCAGPLVSVARVYRSALNAADLGGAIAAHIAADPNAELEGVEFAWRAAALDPERVPPYARQLLRHVLPPK